MFYVVYDDTSDHNLKLEHYGGDYYGNWVLLEVKLMEATEAQQGAENITVEAASLTKTDDHTISLNSWHQSEHDV